MDIRKATPTDAPAILAVTHRAFTLYHDELHADYVVAGLVETVDDILQDIAAHHVYVAELDGQIVGSIRFQKLTDDLAYIYRFGVSPDINNTGIGSRLLATVIEQCRRDKFKAIALHTNSRYYKLARYYYGKHFYVHSTSTDKGYIRALFVLELDGTDYDISPAYSK